MLFNAANVAAFNAVESDTETESVLITSNTIGVDNLLDDRLYLYVEGDVRDAAMLRVALTEAFAAEGVTTVPVDSLDGRFDAPVLAVFCDEVALEYSPIRSNSKVDWQLYYSATGNAAQLATLRADNFAPIDLTDADPYVSFGLFTTYDVTTGIFTLPSYRTHITDEMAAEAVRNVEIAQA
ncbi:hypothetical protein [Haladaptatus sp. GCM10025893]|uniref:hypothetical protein n=1 Tax=Haladaptatus sp. GCM10025893 TaxID=3252659 RepID=UPI003623264F